MTDMLTFPGVDPAAERDGSLWAFAAGQRKQCPSRFYGHPRALVPLWCCVDHATTGGEGHGAMVGPHFVSWTTAQAAAARSAKTCANPSCEAFVSDGRYCSGSCEFEDRGAEREIEVAA